jgi:hypothetical protein
MGDQDFQKFMDDNEKKHTDNLPFYLVLCAREKAKTIIDLYSASLEFLIKSPNSVSTTLLSHQASFIKKLQEESFNTLRQFDMIMIDSEPYEEDEKGPPEPEIE